MCKKYEILDNIKKILKEQKMTLEELSKNSGVKIEKILEWNGRFPSIDKLERVANILGKSAYFLVNGKELPEGTIVVMGDDGREVLTGEKAEKMRKLFEKLWKED